MTKDELTKKTVKELLVLAQRQGLYGVSRLHKAQLIAKLLEVESTAPPPSAVSSRTRAKQSKRSSTKGVEDLTQQTRRQLLKIAQQRGLTGVSRLRKDQLLVKLAEAPFTVPQFLPSNLPIQPEPEPFSPAAFTPAIETPAEGTVPRPPQPSPVVSPTPELPSAYQENRVVLLPRDPHQLYAYWDVSPAQMNAIQPSSTEHHAQFIARVIEVAEGVATSTNGQNIATIALPSSATDVSIAIPQADTSYCVEVGYRTADGHVTVFGVSNVATTPQAEVSPNTEVQWFTPPGYVPSPPPSTQAPLVSSATDHTPGSLHLGPGGHIEFPPVLAPSFVSPLFSGSLFR